MPLRWHNVPVRLGGVMLKHLRGMCALLCLLGPPTLAFGGYFTPAGQFIGTVNPAISTLLGQFPGGGPGLRAAIAQLLEADPSLADDAVFAARDVSPAQKEAVGAGLADAAGYFSKCGDGCKGAESAIRTAMTFADAGTQAAINLAEVPTLAQGIPGFGNAGAQTGGCAVVSPSRPNC
jgi:hypothetical protein